MQQDMHFLKYTWNTEHSPTQTCAIKQTSTILKALKSPWELCMISHTMFSDHSGIKLETSHRETAGKSLNTQEGNNTLLNNP